MCYDGSTLNKTDFGISIDDSIRLVHIFNLLDDF